MPSFSDRMRFRLFDDHPILGAATEGLRRAQLLGTRGLMHAAGDVPPNRCKSPPPKESWSAKGAASSTIALGTAWSFHIADGIDGGEVTYRGCPEAISLPSFPGSPNPITRSPTPSPGSHRPSRPASRTAPPSHAPRRSRHLQRSLRRLRRPGRPLSIGSLCTAPGSLP